MQHMNSLSLIILSDSDWTHVEHLISSIGGTVCCLAFIWLAYTIFRD